MSTIRPTALHLYTTPLSGCSARIRIATRLKNLTIPTTHHTIDLAAGEQHTAAYRSINPNSSLPALRIDYGGPALPGASRKSITMTQSHAMLDWLEYTFPSPPLVPLPHESPWARARVLDLLALVACDVQPPQSLRYRRKIAVEYGGDGDAWARFVCERGLGVYETLVAQGRREGAGKEGEGGRFSVGDGVTLADVCLVPAVQGALRVGVGLERWPLVRGIVEECWKLDAFREGGVGEDGKLYP